MSAMSRLDRAATIDDLREMARRRVPRIAFDFLDGGAGSEASLRRNRAALDAITLTPRVLRDVAARGTTTSLFGRTYAAPIGVAPVGLANLIWPGADRLLASAARDANLPYILSTAGTTSIEDIAAAAPDHAWFQLYVAEDERITTDLMRRAGAAGIEVLVVTLDAAVPGKRCRDLRNGFTLPLRPTLPNILDLARRPAWLAAMARQGAPGFATLAPYAPPGGGARSHAAFMAQQVTARLDGAMLARIRDRWPGRLVLKGILAAEDAVTAADLGADGIIVSNHGGRQSDVAPASIEALPAIREAVGDRLTVMMDSGVRSGGDVARALAHGAEFCFSARSFLYGAGAAGAAGAAKAAAILIDETNRTMGLLGHTGVSGLRPGTSSTARAAGARITLSECGHLG